MNRQERDDMSSLSHRGLSFCALGILALSLLGIGAPAQADTVVRMRFVTGGDDLRGGNISGTGNNVYVRFLNRSGVVVEELRNGNKSATWGGGSVNDVTLLDVGRVGDFASVEISVSDRMKNDIFEQVDNWNLEALRVTVSVDGVERTLFDQRGTPLARLTAGAAPTRFDLSSVEDRCSSDAECDDAVYCNGAERCLLRDDGSAVLRQCAPPSAPVACGVGLSCSEAADRCMTTIVDADGDGAQSAETGGTDCDDNNPGRHPGAAEFCDQEGLDEDCDLSTAGFLDMDGDGHNSERCFNWGPPRT